MSETELLNVTGGAGWGFWAVIGGAVSFVLGFFEGITNPVRCGR
jgi:hypothetical protein